MLNVSIDSDAYGLLLGIALGLCWLIAREIAIARAPAARRTNRRRWLWL